MKNENYTLLVVDDNEINRDILLRRLTHYGYTTKIADCGQSAINIMGEETFDMVLLDLMMPDLNGYQVLEYMKSQEDLNQIPVVMVSAIDEADTMVKCIELGAEDYLTKPVNTVLLEAKVAACLEKRRMRKKEAALRKQIEGYNNQLQEKVSAQVKEISSIQLAAIFAMSKLAESRDPETGEHLERVREYCKLISAQLSILPKYTAMIDQTFIDNIYAASPLHDIGKVGVPDKILLKEGKLTGNEWNSIKMHPVIGAETLRAVDKQYPGNSFIQTGIDIAEFHHEKWNGNGYPHGLSKDQIPLVARIMALGDVYDALTSKRCYKEAFSHEKSVKIITKDSGEHFDPEVIDAFLNVEKEFMAIRDIHQDSDKVLFSMPNGKIM